MRRALRENAPCALLALAGCATLAWLGLYGFTWTDYEAETQPSLEALVHGHLARFLSLAPVYGGSLIERAPFALLPGLWGGGALAVYRAVAVPCLLAVAVIAVVLVAAMRAEGKPRLARGLVLALLVANPLSLLALETGHPEELLGGALCLGAILLAAAGEVSRRRAFAAGVLLGLAIANKQWALLASGPLLLALPASLRLRCGAAALAVAALIEAPLLLAAGGSYVHASTVAAAPGSGIFQPWQVWWFLGHHGGIVHGLFGAVKPGYRTGPGWASSVSHPLVLLVGLAVPALLWLRRRPARLTAPAALLMFALVMVLRCVLDTWDIGYYMVPALFALSAWEARTPGERPPVTALVVTVLAWLSFSWLPDRVSPDVQAATFLAWSLPLAALLAWRLSALVPAAGNTTAPGEDSPARALRRRGLGLPVQETTVRPFGSPVSTSQPSARTTARSSMRTPSASGR
jgi:hypothetical protein